MKHFSPSIDKATSYCTYCPKMCRFSCPVAEAENRETVTPWGLMRLVEFLRQDILEPTEEIAETLMHCTGCRRCQTWCKHGNDIPEALFEARVWLRDQGHVPEALDGFSEYFAEGNSPHPEPENLGPEEDATSDVFDEHARIAFFVDCETRRYNAPLIPRVGKLLEEVLGQKVRLVTRDKEQGHGCCGFPMLSAGDKEGYTAYRNTLETELRDVDYVVTDCAAFASLHRNGGSFGWKSELEVVHIIELLSDIIEDLPVKTKEDGSKIMLHDSCYIGRHLDLFDETRAIVSAVFDPEPAEFQFNRDDASCCGGAAHYHVVAPEASKRCASERLSEMDREGGSSIICGSATCDKAFKRARDANASTVLLNVVCTACGF